MLPTRKNAEGLEMSFRVKYKLHFLRQLFYSTIPPCQRTCIYIRMHYYEVSLCIIMKITKRSDRFTVVRKYCGKLQMRRASLFKVIY